VSLYKYFNLSILWNEKEAIDLFFLKYEFRFYLFYVLNISEDDKANAIVKSSKNVNNSRAPKSIYIIIFIPQGDPGRKTLTSLNALKQTEQIVLVHLKCLFPHCVSVGAGRYLFKSQDHETPFSL